MAVKIYLYDNEYDCIGTGSCSLQNIQWQLEWAAGQDIEVHISSVGGDAFQAVAIYNLLKQHQGKVTVYIDSVAASAACTIAMAGEERIMSKYALLMIHKPSVATGGTVDDIGNDVKMLEITENNIISILADTSGQDAESIKAMLAVTTWLDADTAFSLGFVTKVEDYSSDVKNAGIVSNYVKAAPKNLQKVINKILIPQNKEVMTDNTETIKKTESLLTKFFNLFKATNHKITTPKGDKYIHGVINHGALVFNDADMDTAAEDDDDMEVTDSAGNKLVLSLKDGKITNVKKAEANKADDDTVDEDEEKDDDTEVENKAVLNAHNIKVTNKMDRKVVINAIASKFKTVSDELAVKNALLVEVTNQLKVANEANKKTEEEIRETLKSEFTPNNSHRSNKSKTETQPFFAPQTELAKNAVKRAVNHPANQQTK